MFTYFNAAKVMYKEPDYLTWDQLSKYCPLVVKSKFERDSKAGVLRSRSYNSIVVP